MTIEQLYEIYLRTRAVTTDSRQVEPGGLFFALRGERFDGNAFVPKALEQGAAVCVTSNADFSNDSRCMVVDDVLATLQALACESRRHLGVPVVGITGTNGKTTTKELVAAVLSRRYRISATQGNLNNHIGVPLTLLAIPEHTEVAIVEMGANHPGEIAQLCAIADPGFGLITNVGHAHIEGFGSFEGVVATKTELYRHLAGCHGLAFVNADDSRLMHEATKLATIPGLPSPLKAYMPDSPAFVGAAIEKTPLSLFTYGSETEASVNGRYVESAPYVHFYFEVEDRLYNVHTHLLGAYNFANCMAAVAVGLYFGVDPWDIKEAIEAYVPTNHRSEYKETARSNRLYLDCYNANPSSMEAAIGSFAALPAEGKRVAIIGGMHELGRDEHSEHVKLVERLDRCKLDQCLLVGPEFRGIGLSPRMRLFATTEELAEWLGEHPVQGAVVLVKGSNTNRLWTLEDML